VTTFYETIIIDMMLITQYPGARILLIPDS